MQSPRHPHLITWDPRCENPSRHETVITRSHDAPGTGMDFDLLRLAPEQQRKENPRKETAWLLLDGALRFSWGQGEHTVEAARHSLLKEEPVVLHVPANVPVTLEAISHCELAVLATENPRSFDPMFFDGSMLREHRDRGKWGDAAWRIVRTIFDGRNRPEANLVLGEVLNLPGRWSSYPPHHHPQPEIYHYRFFHPSGYGHAELGDAVLKVRHRDTLLILDEHDHSQVAAPGYAMYYLWVIRHLPGNPYTVPVFHPDHRWLLESDGELWMPEEER